jgi:hypothetical protein
MYKPHKNWNHGTETQQEELLHRPLLHSIFIYVVKGKQFIFSKTSRPVLGRSVQWVPQTFPGVKVAGM